MDNKMGSESIGVGNQGETLARMEVDLWTRLSLFLGLQNPHKTGDTNGGPPSKPTPCDVRSATSGCN